MRGRFGPFLIIIIHHYCGVDLNILVSSLRVFGPLVGKNDLLSDFKHFLTFSDATWGIFLKTKLPDDFI